MLWQDQRTIWVRNTQVPLDPRVINAFYNLAYDVDCEYSKMIGSMTPNKQGHAKNSYGRQQFMGK